MNIVMNRLSVRHAQNQPSHMTTHNALVEPREHRDPDLLKELRIQAIANAVALCQVTPVRERARLTFSQMWEEQEKRHAFKREEDFESLSVKFFSQPEVEYEMIHLDQDYNVAFENVSAVELNGM